MLTERVKKYNSLLKAYGLNDHQVKTTLIGGRDAFSLLFYRLVMLALLAVFLVPGLIFNTPIAMISRAIAKEKAVGEFLIHF